MGSLNSSRVKMICSELNVNVEDYPSFIETGTYAGGTCLEVIGLFSNLYTIEITQHYYDIAKKNFEDHAASSITQILGDSYTQLPKILDSIDSNVFVWLDAHVSGDAGLGLGFTPGPVLEECRSLNDYCRKKKKKAVIVIDDYRLFGTSGDAGSWNGVTRENILHRFADTLNENLGVHIKDDSLYFHISG